MGQQWMSIINYFIVFFGLWVKMQAYRNLQNDLYAFYFRISKSKSPWFKDSLITQPVCK